MSGMITATRPADLATHQPVHEAAGLTKGGVTATIVHHGQYYTLRITRQGKLILTK